MQDSSVPETFREHLVMMKFITLQSLALISDIDILNNFKSRLNTFQQNGLTPIGSIYLATKFNQIALVRKMLNKIAPEIISFSSFLRQLNLYLNSRDSKLLEEINNYDISDKEKARLNHNAASKLIIAEQSSKAQEFIEKATKLASDDQAVIETAIILQP